MGCGLIQDCKSEAGALEFGTTLRSFIYILSVMLETVHDSLHGKPKQ